MYLIDPVTDPRWSTLVDQHPLASGFHTSGWLGALRRTYGFLPIAFTTSASGQPLDNGIAFCAIHSWATGRRLVSLPYSDHCDPLIKTDSEFRELESQVRTYCARNHYKYVEVRSVRWPRNQECYWESTDRFVFHCLDLTPPADRIFATFDKSCVQQRIRRAAKENLAYEEGQSESLILDFYQLLVLTRARHHVPPQPVDWFRNLISSLGPAATVHMLRVGGQPIASILSVGHRQTLIAKYSCSDEEYKKLGATPLLFWKVIQYGRDHGYIRLDLGRCNLEDEGLATFKRRLGAVSSDLQYWRHYLTDPTIMAKISPPRFARQIVHHLPPALLVRCGKVLYKHFD